MLLQEDGGRARREKNEATTRAATATAPTRAQNVVLFSSRAQGRLAIIPIRNLRHSRALSLTNQSRHRLALNYDRQASRAQPEKRRACTADIEPKWARAGEEPRAVRCAGRQQEQQQSAHHIVRWPPSSQLQQRSSRSPERHRRRRRRCRRRPPRTAAGNGIGGDPSQPAPPTNPQPSAPRAPSRPPLWERQGSSSLAYASARCCLVATAAQAPASAAATTAASTSPLHHDSCPHAPSPAPHSSTRARCTRSHRRRRRGEGRKICWGGGPTSMGGENFFSGIFSSFFFLRQGAGR